MTDLTINQLRELEGLSRNAHQTLENIIEKMRTPIHEPVIRECWNGDYMWDGGLD